MSKMTQRRMARRATRKLGEVRRKNRRLHVEVNAMSDNLQSAFKALAAQRDTIRQLKEAQAGAPNPET